MKSESVCNQTSLQIIDCINTTTISRYTISKAFSLPLREDIIVQIGHLDNGTNTNNKPSLTPAASLLIEKLADSGLLINKLTATNQQSLSLSLSGNTLISALQLPTSVASIIANSTQQPAKIRLSVINNQVQLTIEATRNDNNTRVQTNPVEIRFARAQVIDTSSLKLEQPLLNLTTNKPNNENRMNESTTSTHLKPSATTTLNQSANLSVNKITTETSNTLNSVIADFLKSKPVQSPVITNSLKGILTHYDKFIDSTAIKQLMPNTKNNTLVSTQPLDKLIAQVSQNSNATTAGTRTLTLFSQLQNNMSELEKLISQTKISSPAATNSNTLKQSIASSGLFNEASLKALSLSSSTINQSTGEHPNLNKSQTEPVRRQAEGAQYSDKLATTKLTNLKMSGLQFKHTIEMLIKNLSNTQNLSVHIPKLITGLIKTSNPTEPLQPLSRQSHEKGLSPTINDPNNRANQSSPALSKQTPFNDTNAGLKQSFAQLLPDFQWSKLNNASRQLTQQSERTLITLQKQVLNEMLVEVNNLINKIETNQLLSLKNEAANLQQYLVDLPIFKNGSLESFEMLFTSDENEQKQMSQKTWSVTIKFDLDPLGPMFAKVSFKNQRISTHFFAENKETATLLSENLHHLKDSLFIAGVDTDTIEGSQGIVPKTLKENTDNRLDIRI